jgi:hypothetical protein
MIELIIAAEILGYTKKDYGYRLVTDNSTHWISFYGDKVQMYAYFTDDPECDKIYDTGVIAINADQLETLFDVLVKNHF